MTRKKRPIISDWEEEGEGRVDEPKRLIWDFELDLFVTSSRFRAVSGSMLFHKEAKELSVDSETEGRRRGRTNYMVPSNPKRDQVASSALLVSNFFELARLHAPTFESVPLNLERSRSESESHGGFEILEESGGRAESQIPGRRERVDQMHERRERERGLGRETHFDSAATRTAALSSSCSKRTKEVSERKIEKR